MVRMLQSIWIVIAFLHAAFARAHGEIAGEALALKQNAFQFIILAAIVVGITVLVMLTYGQPKTDKWKKIFFLGIVVPIVLSTVYLAGITIYANVTSTTGGPVHWHADLEIWKCNTTIDLKDPVGLTNRLGSPVFHEHGDQRIHVEGVVSNYEEISLHRFFESIGGALNHDKVVVPTNEGLVVAENGELCAGQPGKVQVFAYAAQDDGFTQRKVDEKYVISPYSSVPPGDCVIVEFDREKQKTDKICKTYARARERGELHGR